MMLRHTFVNSLNIVANLQQISVYAQSNFVFSSDENLPVNDSCSYLGLPDLYGSAGLADC